MEEKILISSERYSFRKILTILAVLFFASFVLNWIIAACRMFPKYLAEIEKDPYSYYATLEYWFFNAYFIFIKYATFSWLLIPIGAVLLVEVIFFLVTRKTQMVVTNRRVYGSIIFGKRVDIPIDSVSAVATIPLVKGIAVASSSGRIAFPLINNASEIFSIINNLLVNRQNTTQAQSSVIQSTPQSNASELKQYKELLDSGVITQEEFDAKKRQLLDL